MLLKLFCTCEGYSCCLCRVSDVHNVDIQWRIARVLTEKALLSKKPEEKKHLLHEAKEHVKKALAVEPAKGSSGAHKWFVFTYFLFFSQ